MRTSKNDQKKMVHKKCVKISRLVFIQKSFAIKKGKSLEREEMKVLVSNLFACNFPSICPSGNPTIINLAFNDITKHF